MPRRVTAILVAADGADWLRDTLEAITAQTRLPDRLVVVQIGSSPVTAAVIAGVEPTVHARVSPRAGFGHAVATGVKSAGLTPSDDEWLWLLAGDNAPDPTALERLEQAVEAAPSVGVAGPKQMQWGAPAYLRSFGETMTPFGTTVELAEPELDQGQYDRVSDVLAVAAGGLLVHEPLWREQGGFDPALPAVDDALDFCIRARLAGHRVQLVPSARVRSAGIDAPGTRLLGASTSPGRRARLRREAQLHRRLAYAPLLAVPLHWLSLLPLAVARALGQLLRKQPGAAPAELLAAVVVAGTCFARVPRARSRIARTRRSGWNAIAPLRLTWTEVRHRRALARDNGRPPSHADRPRFVEHGGLATVLAVGIPAVIVLWPYIGAPALVGGGLLPLGSLQELWRSVGWGHHPVGLGFTGPADPFAFVVAVLGSLTFWHPSAAVVVLWVAALPIAAAGGWFATARFTRRPALRAVGGLLWATAPTLLVALHDGRIAGVLVHLAVPFALLAAMRVRRSWTASANLALLGALIAACSPVLLPLLAACWVAAIVLGVARRARDGTRIARILPLPLPAAVLFLPLLAERVRHGEPLAVLADPGVVPAPGAAPHLLGLPEQVVVSLQLAAGWPTWASGSWEALTASLGLSGGAAAITAWSLGAPLLLLAVLGLFWPRRGVPIRVGVAGIGGLVAAVLATRLQLAGSGAVPVSAWPGAGLSLAWLGVLEAAICGLDRLSAAGELPFRDRFARRARRVRTAGAAAIGFTAVLALLVAVAPLLGGALLGSTPVRVGTEATVPALAAAEAQRVPGLGLLVLRAQPDGGVSARVVRGDGETLESQSTLQSASDRGQSQALADLVAGLVQPTSDDLARGLDAAGIGYVLLEPGASDAVSRAGQQAAASALGADPVLATVSTTATGTLYRFADVRVPAGIGRGPSDLDTPLGVLVLAVQVLVLGLTLLLALPTGRLATRLRPVPVDRPADASPSGPVVAARPRPLAPEQAMLAEVRDERQPVEAGSWR